jgi:hypothetical protein
MPRSRRREAENKGRQNVKVNIGQIGATADCALVMFGVAREIVLVDENEKRTQSRKQS